MDKRFWFGRLTHIAKVFSILLILTNFQVMLQAQIRASEILLNTKSGTRIKVTAENIVIDGVNCYDLSKKSIRILSKRNRLLETAKANYLFPEEDGRPNLNRLLAYKIEGKKILQVADAISSNLQDLDGDGNCSVLIKKPENISNLLLANPPITSERINGPANVRAAINGEIILSLNDNVAVSSFPVSKEWYKIAISVDLINTQIRNGFLPKATTLFKNGIKIGTLLQPLKVSREDQQTINGKIYLTLFGYTAINNIKPQTQPENIISHILTQSSDVAIHHFSELIKGFELSSSRLGNFDCYQMDYGMVDGPSARIRLMLVFSSKQLIGVVHAAPVIYHWSQSTPAYQLNDYTLIFSLVKKQTPALTEDFLKQFKKLMRNAG